MKSSIVFDAIQTYCCGQFNCCTKRHQLHHHLLALYDTTNPPTTLCIAEAGVSPSATTEAGEQSISWEAVDEEYDPVTFEHRRSIEADYHPINCLAQQPQVR